VGNPLLEYSVRAELILGSVLLCALCGFPSSVQAHEKDAQEIEVSALTSQEKVQWARATKVPLIDAVRSAIAQTPGQAIQATLESLKGRLLYEVEIVTPEGAVVEVFIDPQSGKVVEAGGTK
jgi:uncharacterized membrane protein YkoI